MNVLTEEAPWKPYVNLADDAIYFSKEKKFKLKEIEDI